MILKSFPRGGKKPNIKPSNNLFSKQKKIKVRKQKSKSNVIEEKSSDEPITLNTAENLRRSTLHEGMVILGRVFKVTDYFAVVSLPGQISGKLKATDVSESYTNLLKNLANNEEITDEFKPLSDLYKEGDYIVCFIKELNSENILLSLEPHLVNQNLNPNFLAKYSKLVATVSSIEDHGYVLETGLKNLRAFLSLKDLENEETKFYPGQQILCAIKDLKNAENTYTAKVSVKLKHLDAVQTKITSLDSLIPGTRFSLTVNKILKNGLQICFDEKNIGYINELYLQNPLSSFEKGQEIVGTLLYITPTVKFAFFSLLSQEQEKRSFSVGDIVTKAKVLANHGRGIILHLKKGVRGFIPLKRTEVDCEKLSSKFSINSIHKCKIIAYDLNAKLYICTVEKKLMQEEYIKGVNLQLGSIVEVNIDNINNKNGYLKVSVGKIFGTVPPDQVSDPGSTTKPKIGQTVTAKVLESKEKIIFTLKKSLIESKLPILCKHEDAKVGSIHDGTIVRISDQGIVIRFFDNVKGWIPKRFLNSKTASQNWNLVPGQTITTVIKKIDAEKNQIILDLSNKIKVKKIKYRIGDIVEGVAIDVSTDGIQVRLKHDNEEGPTAFLPAGHISPCHEVGKLLAAKTVAGETLSATVFSIKPTIILSSTFVPEKVYKFNDLNLGDTLLCSVKRIQKESVKVVLPILNCTKYGTVPGNNTENIEAMYESQVLFGKVTRIDKEEQEIILTTQLSKLWKSVTEYEVKMMTAIDVLICYLNKISELSKNVYYTSKSISKISIGQRIKGTVENIVDHGLILKLENDVKGIVCKSNFSGNYKQGDQIEGTVLWVNYPHEYVEITLIHQIMNKISVKQNKQVKIPIGVQLRGEIVLITDWFVLVLLKGQVKGTLVALPSRRHLNDIEPDLSPYQIGNKVRCYGVLNQEEANALLPICMLKSSFETHNPDFEKSNTQIKRKIENVNDDKNSPAKKKLKNNKNEKGIKSENNEISESEHLNTGTKNAMTIKEKRKAGSDVSNANTEQSKKKKKVEKINNSSEPENDEKSTKEEEKLIRLGIPECGFKWDSTVSNQEDKESSSSSEDEVEESTKPKKKKLTPADKRELERQKEREIREKEEALASCQIPQTVNQFDRLVLSSPDSSLVWMQYMAYHLQATEIDKARAVAKRALKTINFREEDERLNVWQAWLNLESRFGTLESLNEVFQEAVQTNDALKVNMHMLTVHTDAGRQSDLEKVINTMIAKFKQNPETWIHCGAALLKIGMKEKSRHIMQRALQSLPANKHVDLMVKFAQLESKFGDKERSQTLFEQILTSYPKRTDVWSSYVDSLVKSDNIEIARKVLDRAITQSLAAKRMKVLFKKYISFEEKHGTPENVSKVKELAAKYVEEQCS